MISSYFGKFTENIIKVHDPLIKEVHSEVRQLIPEWTSNRIIYQIAQIAHALIIFSSAIGVLSFYHLHKARVITPQNCSFFFVSLFSAFFITDEIAKRKRKKLHSSLFMVVINNASKTSNSIWNKLQKHGKSVIDLDFTSSPALYLTNEIVSRIAKACPNLESLTMDARLLTDEGLQALNTHSPKIKSLTLINCKNLTRDYYRALEKFEYLRRIDIKLPAYF